MTASITFENRLTGRDLVRRAQALRGLLRQNAMEVEDSRRLTPAVHQALVAGGFFRMTMPPRFGTGDITLSEIMQVLEALAEGDASTAWTAWAGLGVPAMAALLPLEGEDSLFAPEDACLVASVAGMGRAEVEPGGLRVGGRWGFMSGVMQATFVGGLCFVFENGEQRMNPDGSPVVVLPIWEASRSEVFDTWDTTGLRGTGSHDVAVQDVFVPAEHVIDFSRKPREGLNLLHYVNIDNGANVTVAAMALGVAQAALDAFRQLAPGKRLFNDETLAESAIGKLTLAAAEQRLAEARGRLYETVDLMWESLGEGGLPGDEWLPRTSLVSVAAADAAIEVAGKLYRAAGTSAIKRSGVLDRCMRDLLTMGAHKTVQHVNLLIYGGSSFPTAPEA